MLLLIKKSLETPLLWHESEIETPVDLAIGKCMCKEMMVDIKSKDIPDNVEQFALKLKEIHGRLK